MLMLPCSLSQPAALGAATLAGVSGDGVWGAVFSGGGVSCTCAEMLFTYVIDKFKRIHAEWEVVTADCNNRNQMDAQI